MAIDRQGIADTLHFGRCTPSAQAFPAGYWAASPDLEPDAYDPRPLALLAEAGYGDGLALSAVVVYGSFYLSQLEAIQAQLGEIGIDLTVTAARAHRAARPVLHRRRRHVLLAVAEHTVRPRPSLRCSPSSRR